METSDPLMRGFKSCPRVGGIMRQSEILGLKWVSSRAPVWGASCTLVCSPLPGGFQVVPPCGGHLKLAIEKMANSRFKSCPRVGGIALSPGGFHILRLVSSRAPVWGASTL